MRHWKTGLAVLMTVSCVQQAPEGVLATFRGGTVTRQDLDRKILEMPESARRPEDGDFDAWHRSLIRQLAVDAILLREAETAGFLQTADFLDPWQDVRCQNLAAIYVRQHESQAPATEAELVAFYEDHLDEFVEPERRQVSNLYLRRRDEESDASLSERATGLRRRIESGESFENVARRYSDSESRHRGGLLGWIVAGRLDPGAEKVVFSLAEGTLSDPVLTVDGAHMFRVHQTVERRQYTLDEVRQGVARQLSASRAEATAQELLAEVGWPDDSFIPTDDELRTLLQAGNDDALVLRLGEFSLDVRGFRARWQASQGSSASPSERMAPIKWLRALERQRGLCKLAEEAGVDQAEPASEMLEVARQALAVGTFRRVHLRDWLQHDEERLRRHFEDHRARFMSPLRFRLSVLTVPLGNAPNSRMAALEDSRERLDGGELTLDALGERWAGTIEETGWTDLATLRAGEANMAEFASGLQTGEHSPPYLAAAGLQMFRVDERDSPREQTFEDVQAQVLNHLVQTYGRSLYEEFSDELLARADFELLDERLALLQVAGPASSEP